MTREKGSELSIRESKTGNNTSTILCRDVALRVKLTIDRPRMPIRDQYSFIQFVINLPSKLAVGDSSPNVTSFFKFYIQLLLYFRFSTCFG